MNSKPEPLVSVIICFLNEERFLEEAIMSVLTQDYKNWELILVDDGSTDRSTEIALDFEKKFSDRIHYLDHNDHKNRGLSASRNTGIMKSEGYLIAFLDADDVWLPIKLSQQVTIFMQNPSIGLIIEASLYWYDWNDKEHENVLIPVGSIPNKIYQPPFLATILYPLGFGAAPCPSSIMVRKKAFENTGYFEESFTGKYALYEDQAFLCKMYLFENVYVSSACNNMYRQHKDSIVQTVKAAGHYNKVRKYYFIWFKTFLKNKNIRFPEIDLKVKNTIRELNYPFFFKLKHKVFRKLENILK